MNKIALAGGLVALVAGIFGILFMVVPKFVEVFVQLPGGLSDCSVGYLGVFKAGFDSSCLSAEDLAKTTFESVEAFESSTTDFKLLFPASTDFIREASPLYAVQVESLGQEYTDTTLFPAFEGDCKAYYDKLAGSQPALWDAAADQLIMETSEGIGLNVYGGLFNGSSPLVGGPIEVLIETVEAALALKSIPADYIIGSDLGGVDAALTGSSLNTLMPQILSDIVAVEPVNKTTILKDIFINQLADIIADNGCLTLSVRDCVNGAVLADIATAAFLAPFGNNSQSVSVLSAFGATYTNLTGFLGPLVTGDQAVKLAQGNLAGAGIFPDISIISPETGAALAESWAVVAILPANAPALYTQNAAGFVAATTTAFMPLPETFNETYSLCSFFQAVLGDDFTDVDQNPAACSAVDLLSPASANGKSNLVLALEAQGTDPADLESVAALSGLFGICAQSAAGALNISGPDKCGSEFFHSYILSGTYSFSINTAQPKADVQKEATSKCEDDLKDAEAIENAQLLVPIATGAAFVAFIAGIAAAVTEKKVLSIVAAVLVLAGGVCSFMGLNGVRNAPVYSLVSDAPDPDDYELVYKESISLSFGLVNIAGSLVAAIILAVSACKGGAANEETIDAQKKALDV